MIEAAKFRPSREIPFGAQMTGEAPSSTGLTKRLEIEELWNAHDVDSEIADVADALSSPMIEGAQTQAVLRFFDIIGASHLPQRELVEGYQAGQEDLDLLEAPPATEMSGELPEDLMATEGSLLGEVSAEDRRDQIDEARENATLIQNTELNPDLLQDIADAAND